MEALSKPLIVRAMQQSDDLVVVFSYVDRKGAESRRVVSPVRFLSPDRFLGLCLSREEPRQFSVGACRDVRIDLAANYVMPVSL